MSLPDREPVCPHECGCSCGFHVEGLSPCFFRCCEVCRVCERGIIPTLMVHHLEDCHKDQPAIALAKTQK